MTRENPYPKFGTYSPARKKRNSLIGTFKTLVPAIVIYLAQGFIKKMKDIERRLKRLSFLILLFYGFLASVLFLLLTLFL